MRPRFDRRASILGPGYKIITDQVYREYQNGEYMGDLSERLGGRTIYSTPYGKDTIYLQPDTYEQRFDSTFIPKWNEIWYSHGLMPIPTSRDNQKTYKKNFYKNIKNSHVSKYDDEETKKAFKRAQKGN